jgi:hypothetical protein
MPDRITPEGLIDPFSAGKDAAEKKLARYFGKTFKGQKLEMVELLQIADPVDPGLDFWKMWLDELNAQVPGMLGSFAEEAALVSIEITGIGVEWDFILESTQEWASSYGFDLVKGINDNSRKFLQKALKDFYAAETRDRAALIQRINSAPWWGPVRAEMIGITEASRGFEQGQILYAQELQKIGVETDPVWHTNNDDLVCPICMPNNQKRESEGWTVAEVPGHPRCRCWTTLEVVEDDA